MTKHYAYFNVGKYEACIIYPSLLCSFNEIRFSSICNTKFSVYELIFSNYKASFTFIFSREISCLIGEEAGEKFSAKVFGLRFKKKNRFWNASVVMQCSTIVQLTTKCRFLKNRV